MKVELKKTGEGRMVAYDSKTGKRIGMVQVHSDGVRGTIVRKGVSIGNVVITEKKEEVNHVGYN